MVPFHNFKFCVWQNVKHLCFAGHPTSVSNTGKVCNALESASKCNQSSYKDELKLSDRNTFEELQNEMMKKYNFVGLNGALSFNLQKASSVTSANNNITASKDADINPSLTNRLGDQLNPPPLAKRAQSLTQTYKPVDWSDIPPVVPPREPVRSSRNSPPLRSSSTPSPTSFQTHTPSTTSSSGFLSVPSDSSRSKYQVQSSTTAVFSAMPPGQSGSNPVILPIMKDGKQESHTHYFLLGDDKVRLNFLKRI